MFITFIIFIINNFANYDKTLLNHCFYKDFNYFLTFYANLFIFKFIFKLKKYIKF